MKRSILILCIAVNAACLHAQVWSVQGPPSRHSQSAVYDPTSQQMIIFGGQETGTTTTTDLNDTWLGVTSTDQNDSFTQLFPTGTLPTARYGHVVTYNSTSNQMTIFGGGEGSPLTCANDVWVLSGANGQNGTPAWAESSPTGSAPAARVYAAGAYDPNTNSMIIFGGNNCSTGYYNDVWVLSNATGAGSASTWTRLRPSGSPPSQRESASAIYDSVNNILTIYAGDAGAKPLSDVWTLSNANGTGGTPVWTRLAPTGRPPYARTGQAATYDSDSNRMTIFGGSNDSNTLYDSWILTNANGIGSSSWIDLTTDGTAPSLAYQSAVYDSSADEMYVFGGSSSANKLQPQSHAFTLTNANGLGSVEAEWYLGGPAARYGQTAFYDSVTDSWFVFGGEHSSSGPIFGDYWQVPNIMASSNLTWNKLLQSGTLPTARYGQTGLYDSGGDRLILFGGSTGKCQNDYHVLKYANYQGGVPDWVSLTPSGTAPAARTWQASAYAAASDSAIIFGGFNCKSTYFNDVWVANNASDAATLPSWTELSPSGTGPSVRESASAVYDPTTNALILYGGDAGGNPFGDIWVLSNANGSGGTPAWTELQPSNTGPSARSGHTAIYDSVNNIMTIYGGYDGTNVLSDVWILSNANGQGGTPAWTQSAEGQPRRWASSDYDSATDEMITFGGASSVNPIDPTSDLHTLTEANGLIDIW
jgi:hypothetical protein